MHSAPAAWKFWQALGVTIICGVVAAVLVWGVLNTSGQVPSMVSAASAQTAETAAPAAPKVMAPPGSGPSNALGMTSDAAIWRQIRTGQIDGQDTNSGFMIQAQGTRWLDLRNHILPRFGGWLLFGTLALVSAFFVLRGRIRIDAGRSGEWLLRMSVIERWSHWIMAASFILLALTGLNMLYGRALLLPLIDPELFATLLRGGKYIHNYIAFAFMATLALNFILWIMDNLPTLTDVKWVLKGGGIFGGGHPPAARFNAGEKGVFWIVMIGGLLSSLTGLELLWPFSYALFESLSPVLDPLAGGIFSVFPADMAQGSPWTPLAEQQSAQIWHAVVGFGLMAVIIGHIYIATIGMEGAFDGMGKGKVDVNWAKEHHSLWAEKMIAEAKTGDSPKDEVPDAPDSQPAE